MIRALKAFLDALDTPQTAPPQANSGGVQGPAPAPLASIIEAHGVRIAELEATIGGLRAAVQDERERAERARESTRQLVKRAEESRQREREQLDALADVPGDDARTGPGEWVHPVRAGMVAPQGQPATTASPMMPYAHLGN